MKKSFSLVGAILMISLITNFYFILSRQIPKNPNPEAKNFPLLAPRVLIDNPNDTVMNFVSLRNQLKEKIAGYGDSFAFYFQYLPTGVSIGINEKKEFSPRSLGKVPVVMAYYLGQEKQGLETNLVVEIKESEIDPRFGDLWKKGAGTKISLQDAVRLALEESDDTAVRVLSDYVSVEDYKETYQGLDIEFPTKMDDIKLTTKQYASILQALYFSAVLNKNDSQKILTLLTESKFDDKLRAGIPAGIKVAHKIGVLTDEFYADCGIVYLPKRPYMLCMVSQSTNQVAIQRMSEVSKLVYTYVNNANTVGDN